MAAKETSASPTALQAPSHILSLLNRLHKESLDQENALKTNPDMAAIRSNTMDEVTREAKRKSLMEDKFIALDPEKAAFMYNLVRATGATRVVECGTSYGVSTIYLALAVGQNVKDTGGNGNVVATEHEARKAAKAREYWQECGAEVEGVIELREGDLRETLKGGVGGDEEVDFVLMDIWTPMVVSALQLLEPHLRPGAIILCDNVIASKDGYADFFARIKGPNTKYKTVTLPYDGGLEMVMYSP